MSQDVHSLVLLARERLVADFTGERLLAGVQPEVGVQRFLLLERHAAHVAHERVVLQVAVHVVLLLNLKTVNMG